MATPSPTPVSARDQAKKEMAGDGGSTGTTVPPSKKVVPWFNRAYNGASLQTTETMLTVEEAIAKFAEMSLEEKRMLANSLYTNGVISNPNDFTALQNAWSRAVDLASTATEGGRRMSPWDAVGMMLEFGSSADLSKDKPEKTTASKITIASPSDAKALVTSVFHDALGRDPSKDEVAKYTALITGAAKSNPEKSVTTHTYDSDGNTVDTSTVANAEPNYTQLVTDQAKASPEYGAYQAATTYYNAMMQAFASPI